MTLVKDAAAAADGTDDSATAAAAVGRNRPDGGSRGNMHDIHEYAALVARGRPSFIEVKGVTWCGDSPGSDLTMANVPWHAEVRAFCEALCGFLGGEYSLAAEHAHSCCVLIARADFKDAQSGSWRTHIDYDRFQELVSRYYATGEIFTALDYAAVTPAWAVYGAAEAGFDPSEARWRRKAAGGITTIEYTPSGSGCG